MHTIFMSEINKLIKINRFFVNVFFRNFFILVFLGVGVQSNFNAASEQLNYLLFIFPGITIFVIFGNAVVFMNQLSFEKSTGVYSLFYLSNFTMYMSLFIIKIFLYSLTSIVSQNILILCSIFIGVTISIKTILILNLATFVISVVLIFLLTAAVSILKNTAKFQSMLNFLTFPLMMLSGALFNIENLPSWMKMLSSINPLYYFTNLMRGLIVFQEFNTVSAFVGLILLCVSILIIRKKLSSYLVHF